MVDHLYLYAKCGIISIQLGDVLVSTGLVIEEWQVDGNPKMRQLNITGNNYQMAYAA